MDALETAWTQFLRHYCRDTGRRLCVAVRTRNWELHWHLDRVLEDLERL